MVRDDQTGCEDRPRRCHRMIVAVAHGGGWSAVTTIRDGTTQPEIETILARASEVAVAHVWDTVTYVGPSIHRLMASVERERESHPGAGVCGLVIIPATGPNRRRITESRDELRTAFPVPGREWFAALVNPRRPMPAGLGILWSFSGCGRLRPAPALPGWIWTSVGDGPRFIRRRRLA